MSRNALNLNFNKLQYEDFTSCIFTFIKYFTYSNYDVTIPLDVIGNRCMNSTE